MSVKFTIKNAKILNEITDGRLLIEFIAEKVDEVDSVSNIEATSPIEVAVEVKARKLAREKLTEILSALLSGTGNTLPKDVDKTDYKM